MEALVIVLLALVIIYGYVANIAKLVVNLNEDVFVKIVRIIGVFVPLLGIIAGFIN